MVVVVVVVVVEEEVGENKCGAVKLCKSELGLRGRAV